MEKESRARGWRQKTAAFRVPLVLWLRPRGLNRLLDTLSLMKGTWNEWMSAKSQPADDALVLVVCANFNHADWLEGGVGSLLNQTFKRWRLMVVADLSTDHSVDTLKSMAQKDDRIQVIQLTENSGAYVARNTVIRQAPWTRDLLRPRRRGEGRLVGPRARQVGSNSGVVRPLLRRTDAMLRGSKRLYYGYCQCLVSRDVWELLGGFVNRRVAGDTEFFLRVKRASALQDVQIRHSTKVSQLCRVHAGNASNQSLEDRKRWLEQRDLELGGVPTPESLRWNPFVRNTFGLPSERTKNPSRSWVRVLHREDPCATFAVLSCRDARVAELVTRATRLAFRKGVGSIPTRVQKASQPAGFLFGAGPGVVRVL